MKTTITTGPVMIGRDDVTSAAQRPLRTPGNDLVAPITSIERHAHRAVELLNQLNSTDPTTVWNDVIQRCPRNSSLAGRPIPEGTFVSEKVHYGLSQDRQEWAILPNQPALDAMDYDRTALGEAVNASRHLRHAPRRPHQSCRDERSRVGPVRPGNSA